MGKTRSWFIFLLLLSVVRSYSQGTQTTVTGKVIDKATQMPVEFAIVKFKDLEEGFITDSTGYFTLTTQSPVTKVSVSIIGYKPSETAITPGQANKITVQLMQENVQLKEITVKPKKHKRIIDTTALIIYHHVVDNKPRNRPGNITSYHFNEYTKTDYSLLQIPKKVEKGHFFKPFNFFFEKVDTTEEGTPYTTILTQEDIGEEYYTKHPERKRRIIHYKRISGIKSPNVVRIMSYQFTPMDVYENVNIVFLLSFVSPFSPAARIGYDFHVLDTAKIDGRTSYKLNFVGLNPNDLNFKGYAWIDSATWAIRHIYLRPNERANINYIRDYDIEQDFHLVNDSSWMMTSETLKLEGNLIKSMKTLSVKIDKTTVRKDIKTGVSMPKAYWHVPDEMVDINAYRQKFSYIDTTRFDTLTKTERLVYHHWDTLRTIPKYKELSWLYTLATTANLKAGPIEFGRLYKIISRNATEDYRLRLGVRTNYDLSTKMIFSAYGAYGTKDKAWKYEGDARFFLPSLYDRWHVIEFEYKNDMTVLGNENAFLTFDNMLTLFSSNLDKVIKTREVNITYERDWFKGLSSIFTFQSRKFFSMPGEFNYQAYNDATQTYAAKDFFTTEFSGSLRWCRSERFFDGYTYRYFIQTKAPTLIFKYAIGVKDLFQGDYNYQKFTLEFDHRWQLPVIGHSVIYARVGYIYGNAPYAVAFLNSSNIGFIRDSYSFQLTVPYEFVMDKFLQVWYEHYFDGLLFNRIPYLKHFHLREFIMCKMMVGGFSAHNSSLMLIPTGMSVPGPLPYIEAGLGVENLFKIVQLNFVWRCTYLNTPGAPNFGFKIGIKPVF